MKINKKNKTCRKKEKSDIGAAILFLAPNFIGFMIFTLIPMVFSLVMSLYDWPLTGTHTFIGLKNFITLFTKDILFFKVMKNTANYAQTECQFRYCGTAIPFLTVRSTAR